MGGGGACVCVMEEVEVVVLCAENTCQVKSLAGLTHVANGIAGVWS